jgi:hypothetical protein
MVRCFNASVLIWGDNGGGEPKGQRQFSEGKRMRWCIRFCQRAGGAVRACIAVVAADGRHGCLGSIRRKKKGYWALGWLEVLGHGWVGLGRLARPGEWWWWWRHQVIMPL